MYVSVTRTHTTSLPLHDFVELERALVVQRTLRQILCAKLRHVHLAMRKLQRQVVRRLVERPCRSGELFQERVWAVALSIQRERESERERQ